MNAENAASRFPCFGGEVAIEVVGQGAAALVRECAALALDAHVALTRFDPASELSRLNRSAEARNSASPLLCSLAAAVRAAGEDSGGLVDATCLDSLEMAGYRDSLPAGLRLAELEPVGGPCRPAILDPARNWALIEVDEGAGTITRPPGTRLDSGGLGKGLVADLIARNLADCEAFSVDCGGDLRIGGAWPRGGREVTVASPDADGPPVAQIRVTDCGLATSGTSKRSWRNRDGAYSHHLMDPGRGVPAHTGVVQATAFAPTALEAEVLAKTALLSGPAGADVLVHGGWLVAVDGRIEWVDPMVAA